MVRPERWDGVARLAGAAALAVGCLLVLQPFMTPTLLAAVIALSVWPAHDALRRRLRGRDAWAAGAVVLALTLVVLAPIAWLAALASQWAPPAVRWLGEALPGLVDEAPARLEGLPWVGPDLAARWRHLSAAPDELVALVQRLSEPAQQAVVRGGLVLGEGVVTTALALGITFFLLRDGDVLARLGRRLADRLTGGLGDEVTAIIDGTVRSVIYGIFGTAAAQASVALVGFWLVGAPSPVVLAAATFVLSLVPAGPPLVWGGLAAALFYDGRTWAAGFMLVYGALVISSIDNVVKPMIIARGASLPFVLVLGGVLGGVLAFGFVGLFLGPTLLAVGGALTRRWLEEDDPPATTP